MTPNGLSRQQFFLLAASGFAPAFLAGPVAALAFLAGVRRIEDWHCLLIFLASSPFLVGWSRVVLRRSSDHVTFASVGPLTLAMLLVNFQVGSFVVWIVAGLLGTLG